MERNKSFIESILEKQESEVTLKLKIVLDELHEEVVKELTQIIHKTIKDFSVDSLEILLKEKINLEVDIADNKLYASNFYDVEFGLNLLDAIESNVFQNKSLMEKISVLLPKAARHYVFTINK